MIIAILVFVSTLLIAAGLYLARSQSRTRQALQERLRRALDLPEPAPERRGGYPGAKRHEIDVLRGRAIDQKSKAGEVFAGGGPQYRFLDFDPGWIVATRRVR